MHIPLISTTIDAFNLKNRTVLPTYNSQPFTRIYNGQLLGFVLAQRNTYKSVRKIQLRLDQMILTKTCATT